MAFLENFSKYDFPNFGFIRLPNIQITKQELEDVGAKEYCTNFDFLRAITLKGYNKKKHLLNTASEKEYIDRIKRELDMFKKLSFVDYILLVWKVCHWSDKNKIARDYGRGSAAGSLVFFLLNVTSVEPMRYELFFERFVSEARANSKIDEQGNIWIDGSLAPDVDIDFEQARRAEVVQYLKSEYPNRVCKIGTLNTLSGKLLIKECGKIITETSEDIIKMVANLIPKKHGIVADIEDTYNGIIDEKTGKVKMEPVLKFKEWADENPLVYQTALKLRDLIKNKASHPSGYVVSFGDIGEYLPLENSSTKGQEGELITPIPMEFVAYLTTKLDLLGVRCCTVVANVLEMANINVEDINVDSDPIIYDNLRNLRTPQGIFQIEAPTNLQVCRKVMPKNLSELSDVVAIARPGALSFLDKYTKDESEEIHPLFDKILASSRGVCLYQEQMMQLAHAVGFTLTEAETLRRIVGKKKVDQVKVWQEKIHTKVKENGLPDELADLLWKILDDSASYSFNKSHSVSYASLAALTTYLKFKYPLYFYTSLLNQSLDEPNTIEEIRKIYPELVNFGIELLPPSLVKSQRKFVIEDGKIRYGLEGIKGLNEKTIEKICQFKPDGPNKLHIFEAASEAGVTISAFCALIQCGCMDGTDPKYQSRPRLTLEAQFWNVLTPRIKKIFFECADKFQYNLFAIYEHVKTLKNSKGVALIKERQIETIRNSMVKQKAIYDMNRQNSKLASFFYERMLLGYSYSISLSRFFIDEAINQDLDDMYKNMIPIDKIDSLEDNDKVSFIGMVQETFEGTGANEKQTKYAKLIVDDGTGSINCLIFNSKDKRGNIKNKIEEIKMKHGGELPQEDDLVFCSGIKKSDAVFIDKIAKQDIQIYTKYKDIKKEENNISQTPI